MVALLCAVIFTSFVAVSAEKPTATKQDASDEPEVELHRSIVELTPDGENTLESIRHSERPWLVEFYAPWCGYCKSFTPVYNVVAGRLNGKVNVARYDGSTQKAHKLGLKLGVIGFPTLRVIYNDRYYTFPDSKSDPESIIKFAEGGFKAKKVKSKQLPSLVYSEGDSDKSEEKPTGLNYAQAFDTWLKATKEYIEKPTLLKRTELAFLVTGFVVGSLFAGFVYMFMTFLSLIMRPKSASPPASKKDD